jgi:hypothetical protein
VEGLDRQGVAREEGSIAALGDDDLPAVSGIALAGSRPGPVPVPGPRVVDLARALPVALRAGPLTISECRGVIGAAPDEIGAALIAARSAGFVIRYGVDGRLHLVEGV